MRIIGIMGAIVIANPFFASSQPAPPSLPPSSPSSPSPSIPPVASSASQPIALSGLSDDQLRVRVRVNILEWYLRNQLDTGFTVQYLRDVASGSNNLAAADATYPSAGGTDEGVMGFFNKIRAGSGELDVAIQALEKTEHLKVLSEPVLTVNAKSREATFFSGQDYPFETLRSTQSALVSVTQFRQIGITLTIKDTEVFAAEGNPARRFIRMNFQVKVSRAGQEIPVILDAAQSPINAPQILSRNLSTTLFLPEHSPFIAGIIKSKIKVENHSGVPLLSEIPVMGALFRSNSVSDQDTELIFLVTPEVLWPGAPPQAAVVASALPPR